jgi:hypothetical protein
MAEPDPVLASAEPGQFAGVEVECPRYDCDWSEKYATAVVVNEYGVRNVMPARCERHDLPVDVTRIVTIVGD